MREVGICFLFEYFELFLEKGLCVDVRLGILIFMIYIVVRVR